MALLDSTIKVLFIDTLKFFLSLYGHKLPVLSMDISTDGTLLVSGSADKNIKVWGLDFGDCHRSLFAHADSVMQVAFVPHTHYVFTVGACPSWVLRILLLEHPILVCQSLDVEGRHGKRYRERQGREVLGRG